MDETARTTPHWSIHLQTEAAKTAYEWEGFAEGKQQALDLALQCMGLTWRVMAHRHGSDSEAPAALHARRTIVNDSATNWKSYRLKVCDPMLDAFRLVAGGRMKPSGEIDLGTLLRSAHEVLAVADGTPEGDLRSTLALAVKHSNSTVPETDPVRIAYRDKRGDGGVVRRKAIRSDVLMALTAMAACEILDMCPAEQAESVIGDESSATLRAAARAAIHGRRKESAATVRTFLKSVGARP